MPECNVCLLNMLESSIKREGCNQLFQNSHNTAPSEAKGGQCGRLDRGNLPETSKSMACVLYKENDFDLAKASLSSPI